MHLFKAFWFLKLRKIFYEFCSATVHKTNIILFDVLSLLMLQPGASRSFRIIVRIIRFDKLFIIIVIIIVVINIISKQIDLINMKGQVVAKNRKL